MAGYWDKSNSQIHDLNGRPLIGARAYFYLGGTTTPIDTFRSFDLGDVNKNPNPVITDGAGFFPSVFLDEDNEFYHMRLTTSSGSLILDVDGIPIIGPTGGGGGSVTPVDTDAILKTGDFKWRYGSGFQSGFVRANARTIGSATSGASERANADTQALFEYLWSANTSLEVLGGRGASAAADWSANKQLTLPDGRGRTMIGLDDMGNTAAGVVSEATAVGWVGGAKTHTLSGSEMPAHSHSGSTGAAGAHDHTYERGAGGAGSAGSGSYTGAGGAYNTSAVGNHSHPLTIDNTGGGAAHNNLQPSMAGTWYIRL